MIPPIQVPSAQNHSTHLAESALRRFEIGVYAEQGASFKGELDAATFTRVDLVEHSSVVWEAKASHERDKLTLELTVNALLVLECQRCLQPMTQLLRISRSYWFARTQMQLERWEEELGLESEVDVMLLEGASQPRIDLLELMEDELILALPYAPKHGTCPTLPKALQKDVSWDVLQEDVQALEEDSRMNPFAILGKLKRDK